MSVSRSLVIGTRGSRLALIQAEAVRQRLLAVHPHCRFALKTIATQGDRDSGADLTASARVGLFSSELERALQASEVDLAVHSLKDVPTALGEGLALEVVTPRADPRDALVTKGGEGLEGLRAGATVGTSSRRRAAFVLGLRRDLVIQPIRGNVETRLAKVARGEYDAAVFALAGLERLGLASRASQVFGPEAVTPAPGQGVVAVEVRQGDQETLDLVKAARRADVYMEGMMERAILSGLGGGCRAPIGALAEWVDEEGLISCEEVNRGEAPPATMKPQNGLPLRRERAKASRQTVRLTAAVGAPDGSQVVRAVLSGPPGAETTGRVLAALFQGGADNILAAARVP